MTIGDEAAANFKLYGVAKTNEALAIEVACTLGQVILGKRMGTPPWMFQWLHAHWEDGKSRGAHSPEAIIETS